MFYSPSYNFHALSGKWKLELLIRLSGGCIRWGNLIHSIPAAAPNVLTRQLRALEQAQLVQRLITSSHPPQIVEYTLSQEGQALLPLLEGLQHWCRQYQPDAPSDFSLCQRVIASRWLLPILLALSEPMRFGSLQRELGEISRGVLASQLQEARDMELVSQLRYEGFPPRVEYSLTQKGRALLEILCPAT